MKRPSAAPVLGIGLTATVAAVAMFPAASGAATRPVELAPPQAVNTIGSLPVAVSIADMNGDGRPDIVTGNADTNDVSILTQNATGTGWTTTVVGPTGDDPSALVVADLNGDTRPDIATADTGSDTVTVLTRDASGPGYTASTAGSTGDAPAGIGVGDVNGDGRPDLATANRGADTVTVLTKDVGGGASYTATTAGTTGGRPFGIVVGDLTGDGRPDIATNDADASSVTLLTNGGAGFTRSTAAITGAFPTAIESADLDGDGRPELVTTNAGSGSASILRRDPTLGGWTTSLTSGVSGDTRSLAIGDLNVDGLPDLVLGDRSVNLPHAGDGVSVLTKDAAGPGYSFAVGVPSNARPTDVAVGDLDGDGRPDIVSAETFVDSVSIYRNVTDLTAPPAPATPETTPTEPAAPAPAAPAPVTPAPALPAKPVTKAPTLKLGTPRVTNGGRVIRIPATVSGAGVLNATATHAAPTSGATRRSKAGTELLTYAGLAGRKVAKGGTYSLALRRTAAGRTARYSQRRITLSVVVTATGPDGRSVKQRRTVRVPTGR
ncbi:FG-GAP repeat domain-containing protein [Patulibacter minatonensis]|uniref:FG-GAP repeat domain-containing protein n=1 Tax=Patulibacter minatonensis TaxID=298163 RepID=UPI00047C3455|nr:VCBS repeat-containing protein [Patulibacter minatonensis]